jgi:hypothetical protein
MASSSESKHVHELEELEEVSSAPESGQVVGGREDPWEGEDDSPPHAWPTSHHPIPKDEL